MTRFAALGHILLASAVLVVVPSSAFADKPRPSVTGSWLGAPPSILLGEDFDLVLRVEATRDAPAVTVAILQSPGIEIVSAGTTWTGSLLGGRAIDLPVTVRVVRDGDWTIGARITNHRPQSNQGSGAVLNVIAANGTATLSRDPHDLMRMAARSTPEEARAMGIAATDSTVVVPDHLVGPAVATTVSGTIGWRDPEGTRHPIRLALVRLTNAAGTILATTGTNQAGGYSAAVNTDSVRVTVFTQDFENSRVIVFPPADPTTPYSMASPLMPVVAGATSIDITSAAIVRGTMGAPSTDSIDARAFSVYDGMLTFWFQSSALIGRAHQQAKVLFPEPRTAPVQCGISCYSSALQQIFIIREDALDWDVLGHEFFHFVMHRSAARVVDTNPGGPHDGGTAIGQNGRNRDQGMRMAWGEGVASALSLLVQRNPLTPFAFPRLFDINDGFYSDLEDDDTRDPAETPPTSDGFGSENSVLGLIWDLSDTDQDTVGFVTDNFAGLNAPLLWAAMNSLLPGCNPCDRVDRFWTGIVTLFGATSPVLFDVGKIFALNNIAPRTFAPVDGESVPGTAAPTFIWFENGDPSSAHENNQFTLVFSRDNFTGHRVAIPVPGLGQDRYTPTDAEWQSVQAGARGGETYKWFVAAKRADAPAIPQNWLWYSNILTIAPRSIEATVTWSPVGADVDLHLANPSGTDIAYYNRNVGWGFLDRDCITTCAQEIISVKSLPLRGAYRLFVHYFSDRGRGPATVRAVVRSGSQVLVDTTFTLSGTGVTQNLIPPFTLDETGTVTRDAVIETELDPTLLPPKRKSP